MSVEKKSEKELTSKTWNADRIRRARKFLGLKQYQVAKHLCCRQQTVSDWENGVHHPDNGHQLLLNRFFQEMFAKNDTQELVRKLNRDKVKRRKHGVQKRKESDKVNRDERGNLY